MMDSFMQQGGFAAQEKGNSISSYANSNRNSNSNSNGASSFFMPGELGRANDFISSLTEQEIGALNSSYHEKQAQHASVDSNKESSATTVSATASLAGSSSPQADNDPYSQLFPVLSMQTDASASASASASSSVEQQMNNLFMPTPIGGSCNIVSTKDQVPLNYSLISQTNSLAQMFHHHQQGSNNASGQSSSAVLNRQPSPSNKKLNNISSMDSLFPNLSFTGIHKIAEADFGSASSPLIAAAAAAASPRANALSLAFQQQQQQQATMVPPKISSYGAPSISTSSSSVSMLTANADDFDDLQHRSQQSTRWKERYQELILYKKDHGDCNVPYLWSSNRPLSEWVKRQRHQYKLKKENKHSALTDEREMLLTQLGFVWNSRASLWDGRFQELVEYFHQHGNLKVSKRTAKHRALSVWLKRQRHACRLFLSGDRSTCMTEERMQKLLDLGVKINKKA
ncbi:unnamed protein product [Cylindrotheca closterium]|uniref:Helicase-associated domain-containing protein n=1 Tax=Cylindrotheca closterium TaxID=2856 RepID=A0AAD2CQV2_9STRA|nr:unnamed protein product [Cylindrotheca closterium]